MVLSVLRSSEDAEEVDDADEVNLHERQTGKGGTIREALTRMCVCVCVCL